MAAVWPQHVLNRFATIPVNPRENDYYVPYNKLLNILFPADSPFTVGPQTQFRNPADLSISLLNIRCSGEMHRKDGA